MGNPFVHIELVSTDVDKAKSFYGKLFNWKLEDVDMGDMIYTLIKVGEGTGGGLMKNPMPDGHSMWIAYEGRQCQESDEQSQGSWRQGEEGRYRSQRRRFPQHHHGPNRRDARPLGAEEEKEVEKEEQVLRATAIVVHPL